MCSRGLNAYVTIAVAVAAGVLLGVIFPCGFLVLLLGILVIAVGVLLLLG